MPNTRKIGKRIEESVERLLNITTFKSKFVLLPVFPEDWKSGKENKGRSFVAQPVTRQPITGSLGGDECNKTL